MKKLRKLSAILNLPSVTLEATLFLPEQLEKAALGQAKQLPMPCLGQNVRLISNVWMCLMAYCWWQTWMRCLIDG